MENRGVMPGAGLSTRLHRYHANPVRLACPCLPQGLSALSCSHVELSNAGFAHARSSPTWNCHGPFRANVPLPRPSITIDEAGCVSGCTCSARITRAAKPSRSKAAMQRRSRRDERILLNIQNSLPVCSGIRKPASSACNSSMKPHAKRAPERAGAFRLLKLPNKNNNAGLDGRRPCFLPKSN